MNAKIDAVKYASGGGESFLGGGRKWAGAGPGVCGLTEPRGDLFANVGQRKGGCAGVEVVERKLATGTCEASIAGEVDLGGVITVGGYGDG